MCVYSMVADHYIEKWKDMLNPNPPYPPVSPIPQPYIPVPYVPQVPPTPQLTEEEIKDFRRLLERAKKYDEETGQRDCELEEKKKLLKSLAKLLGVELEL